MKRILGVMILGGLLINGFFSMCHKKGMNAEEKKVLAVTDVSEPSAVPKREEDSRTTEAPVETTGISEPAKSPELTKEPEPDLNREPDDRKIESVKHSGMELCYINTTYRIKEEMLERMASLFCNASYASSFALYDISAGVGICYNADKYFPVASTVKAPFAMTCLCQIDCGEYAMDDTVIYTSKYKVAGTGEIGRAEFGTTYTVEKLVEHMIVKSDNIGYIMLQDYFGYEAYNDFLEDLGNKVTIGNGIKWGKTSSMDSLRNWLEIYEYINSGQENGAFLAELLGKTNKSYIRNALGDKYVVLNKMGWVYDQCCHDHALILAEQPYLLLIMTMGDARAENQRFMEELAVLLDEIHYGMISDL